MMLRGGRAIAASLVAAAALLLACVAQAAPVVEVGQRVMVPELATADGGHIGADALRGKVIVLAWFASYCPFCRLEAPQLQKLYAANAEQLLVVGVNVEQGDPHQAALVQQWRTRFGWTFPVTLDAAAVERALGKPKGIPALVMIDSAGVVRHVETGELLPEDFDDIAAFARRQQP
jgi:thiol-disulfide isomerase/thioredoxin